jgi:hypothetical protein
MIDKIVFFTVVTISICLSFVPRLIHLIRLKPIFVKKSTFSSNNKNSINSKNIDTNNNQELNSESILPFDSTLHYNSTNFDDNGYMDEFYTPIQLSDAESKIDDYGIKSSISIHNVNPILPKDAAANESKTAETTLFSFKYITSFLNAFSFASIFQSSFLMIALPLEFYYYGLAAWQLVIALIVASLIGICFFVPFIHGLESKSIISFMKSQFESDTRNMTAWLIMFLAILMQIVYASLLLVAISLGIIELFNNLFNIQTDMHTIIFVMVFLSTIMAIFKTQTLHIIHFLQFILLLGANIFVIIKAMEKIDKSNEKIENKQSFSEGNFIFFLS